MELTLLLLPTGKSMSEELILASTKPKYDNRLRLFIELRVQGEKTTYKLSGTLNNFVLSLLFFCTELVI